MARVVICGDVHAQFSMFYNYVDTCELQSTKAIIQCGDFGFFPHLLTALTKPFSIPVYAIDGNHENHEWLKNNYPKKHLVKKNFHYQPRGSILTLDETTFGFIGGAWNVDRANLGVSDDTTPYITQKQLEHTIKVFNDAQPDVIISHDCPHSIGIGMKGHPSFIQSVETFVTRAGGIPGPLDDIGDNSLMLLWKSLIKKPKYWLYGHHHKYHVAKIGTTEFYCVGSSDYSDRRPLEHKLFFVYETYSKELKIKHLTEQW
jgi:predicted phosphodiesterase